jgi:hypothetical protein
MGKNKQLHTDAISTSHWAKAGLKERFFCARVAGARHRFGWRFYFHGVSCPPRNLNYHDH